MCDLVMLTFSYLSSSSYPGAQAHNEVLADNRRMTEMLATAEGDSKEMAGLLERLSEDRKKLQRECSELRRRRAATDGLERGSGGGEELSEVRLLWGEGGGGGWEVMEEGGDGRGRGGGWEVMEEGGRG